jgi:hypothetical protein
MSEQVKQPARRPWTVTTFEALAVCIALLEVVAFDLFLLFVLFAAFYLWLTLRVTRKRSLGATAIFTALTVLNLVAILVSIGAVMLAATSFRMEMRSFDWPSFAAVSLNIFQLWLLWNPLTMRWLAAEQ